MFLCFCVVLLENLCIRVGAFVVVDEGGRFVLYATPATCGTKTSQFHRCNSRAHFGPRPSCALLFITSTQRKRCFFYPVHNNVLDLWSGVPVLHTKHSENTIAFFSHPHSFLKSLSILFFLCVFFQDCIPHITYHSTREKT